MSIFKKLKSIKCVECNQTITDDDAKDNNGNSIGPGGAKHINGKGPLCPDCFMKEILKVASS